MQASRFLGSKKLAALSKFCSTTTKVTKKPKKLANIYPPCMDLGARFYDELLDPKKLANRRKEAQKFYPPKDVFMSLLPKMGNADEHQFKIYWDGVYGTRADLPVDPDMLTQKFIDEADPDCVIWLMGRAGNKSTYHNNYNDFENWRIVPRFLTGAVNVDSSISFKLGKEEVKWESPICVAPVGVQHRVTYPSLDGDLVTARGATEVGVPFCVSGVSSISMERIAEEIRTVNPDAAKPWFQLYNPTVPEITMSMLKRAKESGYGAIVVTLDTNKYGFRTEELDAAYFPQADLRVLWSQMIWDPVFNTIMKNKFNAVASEEFSEDGKYEVSRLKTVLASLSVVGCGLGDTWEKTTSKMGRPNDNLEWLLEFCHEKLDMPVLVKGILHPEDAEKAVKMGVDGIIVSNHGGRQVDGSISTIEALPSIVDRVKCAAKDDEDPIPVFLDSGVRYGQHVVKALALGATGVLVGRMPIIGACLGGQEGVKHVLLNLKADTHCTMMNAGVETVADFQQDTVVRSPHVGAPPFMK